MNLVLFLFGKAIRAPRGDVHVVVRAVHAILHHDEACFLVRLNDLLNNVLIKRVPSDFKDVQDADFSRREQYIAYIKHSTKSIGAITVVAHAVKPETGILAACKRSFVVDLTPCTFLAVRTPSAVVLSNLGYGERLATARASAA
jgi:hypothetical protein